MNRHRGTVRHVPGDAAMHGDPIWEFRCGLTHLCDTSFRTDDWTGAMAYALIHWWCSEPDHSHCTRDRAFASVGWL